MTSLPEHSSSAIDAIVEMAEQERQARNHADDLLGCRNAMIIEAMGRGDVSKAELARALGLRRQWLYQIVDAHKTTA